MLLQHAAHSQGLVSRQLYRSHVLRILYILCPGRPDSTAEALLQCLCRFARTVVLLLWQTKLRWKACVFCFVASDKIQQLLRLRAMKCRVSALPFLGALFGSSHTESRYFASFCCVCNLFGCAAGSGSASANSLGPSLVCPQEIPSRQV